VNIPGEAASVVTCLDGYEMQNKEELGLLRYCGFWVFYRGDARSNRLMLFAEPLAEFGLKFGSPEYAALILLGLTLITYLTRGSVIKALIMGSRSHSQLHWS